MPEEGLIKRLEGGLQDDFSRDLLRGALVALVDRAFLQYAGRPAAMSAQ
jgi:hypothetical protein